jgi:hypothetical protein
MNRTLSCRLPVCRRGQAIYQTFLESLPDSEDLRKGAVVTGCTYSASATDACKRSAMVPQRRVTVWGNTRRLEAKASCLRRIYKGKMPSPPGEM